MEPGCLKTSPCNNCPYRKDAPLQHWSILEFLDLIKADSDYMGKAYGCHKNDGSLCTGFVMNQDKRGMQSIALRISLSKNQITVDDLDKLTCKSEMFDTIEEMAIANYPAIKKILKVLRIDKNII